MANPILKSDLVGDDALDALQKMLDLINKNAEALNGLRGALNAEVQSIGQQATAARDDAAALSALLSKLSSIEDAVKALNKAEKETASTEAAVNEQRKKYANLTSEEAKRVDFLAKSLNFLNQNGTRNMAVWQNMTQSLSGFGKSYNEIAATVKVLENALRGLSGQNLFSEGANEAREAVKRLKEELKQTSAATSAATSVASKYKNLTDEEAKSIDALKDALKGTAQEQIDAVQNIEIQNKSYNELYQTYNAIKDALNKMTVEERTSTEAGKAMTQQALELRETLNELQKSTGNYTLQVGKYRAAFDGLGYSFMQIAREAPSALNFDQFLLAISNNIPLFFDQVQNYTKQLSEEFEELKNKTNKSAEELQRMGELANVTGSKLNTLIAVLKRLKTAIFSFNGIILLLTMVLRFLPKIVSYVKELFNGEKVLTDNLRTLWTIINNINQSVAETTGKARTELEILVGLLGSVRQGTEEWKNIIERVNEITGENLNATSATVDEVRNVTDEYIKQAVQLAKNKSVIEEIAKSDINKVKRDQFLSNEPLLNYDPAEALKYYETQARVLLGLDADAEKVKELAEKIQDIFKEHVKSGFFSAFSPFALFSPSLAARPETDDERRKRINREVEGLLNEYAPILNDTQRDDLIDMFFSPLASDNKKGSGRKEKEPTLQDMEDRYWEAERALIEKMKEGYAKERDLARVSRDEEYDNLTNWYVDQRLALDENLENRLVSQEEYDIRLAELDRENRTLRADIERKYWDEINRINKEEAEKALKARENRTIREIEAIGKVEQNAVAKRVRNTAQETARNNALVVNLNKLMEARKELLAMDIASDETRSIEERTKALEKLNKEIAKLGQQLDFSKKLGNYSSISDMITKNINVGDGSKKSILGNIIGSDTLQTAAEALGEGFDDWVDGQFETWLNSATSAVTQWYDTTMGYIGDLMQAYTDLAEAKAEAAAEATSAAQEEYEKEKALLEAGYASRVEATWAEYQEKKAAQEQAEKDAKAAAEAQQQLNEMQTIGSLITASANIFKSLSSAGPWGVAAAVATIAVMMGAFLAAKAKAHEVAQYGEGTVEMIGGGSHASGHDSPLAYDSHGRERRVEGGEMFAVFNRKAVRLMGQSSIENLVNGINSGEYKGSVGRTLALERGIAMHAPIIISRTNLRRLESGVDRLVAIGNSSRYFEPDGTEVMRNDSGVTRITRRR